MLITTGGVLVRTRVSEVRLMGRATQGVTLIAVDDGNRLSGVQRVVESDAAADAAVDPAGDPEAGPAADPAADPAGDGSPDGPKPTPA